MTALEGTVAWAERGGASWRSQWDSMVALECLRWLQTLTDRWH